jgi:flagellar biosynthesis protein FliR
MGDIDMTKIERLCVSLMLCFISVAAIAWIGREYYALLAIFELLIGVVIGMTIFLPNYNGR